MNFEKSSLGPGIESIERFAERMPNMDINGVLHKVIRYTDVTKMKSGIIYEIAEEELPPIGVANMVSLPTSTSKKK